MKSSDSHLPAPLESAMPRTHAVHRLPDCTWFYLASTCAPATLYNQLASTTPVAPPPTPRCLADSGAQNFPVRLPRYPAIMCTCAADKDEVIAALNLSLRSALASIAPLQAKVDQIETRLPTPVPWEIEEDLAVGLRPDWLEKSATPLVMLQSGLYDGLTRTTNTGPHTHLQGGTQSETAGLWIDGEPGYDSIRNRRMPDHRALVSLHGLNNLEFLDGSLRVTQHHGLKTISGFRRLSHLRRIEIAYNPALTEITGFTNLSIINELVLDNNANLTSLAGFSSLRQIRGGRSALRFRNNNPNLDYSGLSNLECHDGWDGAVQQAELCPNCPAWLINLPHCADFCRRNPEGNWPNLVCRWLGRRPTYSHFSCSLNDFSC